MNKEEKLLFEINRRILISKGYRYGKIRPIEDEIFDRLRNYYFACMPIKFHIKYFPPKRPPGNCEERSYLLSYAFDDCEIVRGHLKSLEMRYGKEHDFHFWVESNGKCYDPSTLLVTDKDLYYKYEGVTDTIRISKEQIATTGIAEYINSLSLEVYINDEFRRRDLELLIPFMISSEEYKTNEDFKNEYNEFLISIGYNIIEDEKGLRIS